MEVEYICANPITKLHVDIAECTLNHMEVSAMNLSKILNILYRYLWLLVLVTMVASLYTFLQISSQDASYKVSTDLLVGPALNSPTPDLNSLKIGGELVKSYAKAVDTDLFLEAVNNNLDQKFSLNALKRSISVKEYADTRVLIITVFGKDPKQVVAIANAAAQTLLEMSPSRDNTAALLRAQMGDQALQLQQIISNSQASIEKLEAELIPLKGATPSSPEAVKANLEQQNFVIKQLADERNRYSDSLRTLASIYQILQDSNTNQIEIIEPATTAAKIDDQLLVRVASAGVGGFFFAILIIFFAEYLDDRIRFPGDLSRAAGVPLLSAIAKHKHLKGSGIEQLVTFALPESVAANKYRETVAKLLFSIGETIPHTLLLSSVGSQAGDDAAVIAGNLAVAFDRAGYKVMLVDAQVDNPVLSTIFEADKKEGLDGPVLTKSIKQQLLPVEKVPGIRFLPAGLSLETNSHEMLNSTKIARLLEEIKKGADIVLIVGSPISWFAESLTLASQVDGVILVARPGEAHSKKVNEVVENLSVMNVQLSGVIFDYNSSSSAISTFIFSKFSRTSESAESTSAIVSDQKPAAR